MIPFDAAYLDNDLRTWLLAFATAVGTYAGMLVLRGLVLRHLSALAARTATDVDDIVARVLQHTKVFFLFFVAVYAGTRVLVLPADWARTLATLGVVITVVQAAIWGNVLISAFIEREVRNRVAEDAAAAMTLNALGFLSRLALWAILVLMGLANLGIDITALVTGLGIGGIAVALALQNILGDLFASMSIVLDKPFVIGDFIIVDDKLGTIESIGLKTTRVRSLSGEQLIFPNSDLLKARIRNFKRMEERRVVFTLGVTYQTPREKLAAAPRIIREIVESTPDVRFDRSHFARYGAFSLDIETVFWVTVPEYNTYMDRQESINLRIYERFAAEGLEFADPTQTVFVERAAAGV